MTNEERKYANNLAEIFERNGGNDPYDFDPEESALIARCLHIVAGAKVEEGLVERLPNGNYWSRDVSNGMKDLNNATVYPESVSVQGAHEFLVRRYTFTEQLTTE